MEIKTYIAAALAGVSLVAFLRLLWSSRGIALEKYRQQIHQGTQLHQRLSNDISRLEKANQRLTDAERALRTTLREKENTIEEKEREVRALRKGLDEQKAANDRLNDIIGKQEVLIRQLARDVEHLKDKVTELSAQLGKLA